MMRRFRDAHGPARCHKCGYTIFAMEAMVVDPDGWRLHADPCGFVETAQEFKALPLFEGEGSADPRAKLEGREP